MSEEKRTMIVGAGRGLGRGIACAFAQDGFPVVAVSRTASDLAELAAAGLRTEVADAAETGVAERLIGEYRPQVLVLVAGGQPVLRPLHEQTWEGFSVNWEADVRIAFEWLGAVLRAPLPSGSRVIVLSSGAALAGSPLSGGYAGAKATQRFLTGYARDEADRAGLAITFTAVLPKLTPLTDLGRPAVAAYAARSGLSEADYVRQLGELLTPETAGRELVSLARLRVDEVGPAYLLGGAGLAPLA